MNTDAIFFEPCNMRFDPANVQNKLIANNSLHTRINRALFVTKVLRLQKIRKGEEAEKLVPSSNLFNVFGLTPGKSVTEEVIGEGKGMVVQLATVSDTNTKKIYSRRYKNRSDIETMMDIRHQKKIKSAFAGAKKVHLLIEHGKVTITPILEAEVEAKHLTITFDVNDKKSLYAAAAKTLYVINSFRFSTITTQTCNGTSKALVDLLDLQLRRQGYTTVKQTSQLCAVLPSTHKTLAPVTLDNFPGYKPLKPNIDTTNDLSAFVACTGGVDAHLMELEGFCVNNLMDFSPTEQRDWSATKQKDNDGNVIKKLNDKTEVCLFNALANTSNAQKVALFNEDIFLSDIKRISELSQGFNFLHFSPCCQDYTSLKTLAERERASANLTASRDMFVPALMLINHTRVPTVLFENVVPFGNSFEVNVLISGLESMGYTITKQIIKSSEHNTYTNRNRFYLFATLLSESFSFPVPTPRTVNAWDDVIKHHLMGPFQLRNGHWANNYLRDVSHTKSITKAVDESRSRFMTEHKDIAPAIPRCQSRQVKDALYIESAGMHFYPRVPLQLDLMSIPPTFDLSLVTDEVATEIIGNSVDARQHNTILNQVKKHIVNGIKHLLLPKQQSQLCFSF